MKTKPTEVDRLRSLRGQIVAAIVGAYVAIDSAISQSLSPALFIQHYTRIVDRQTRRVKPYSFAEYPCLIQIANDAHPRQVIQKPSQQGVSTILLRREIYWLVSHPGSSVIYSIPNHEELPRFVGVHVDTCIQYSPMLRSHFIGDRDATTIKQFKVGEERSFMHFQGRSTETSVRMLPADSVVVDEAVLGIPRLGKELTSRVDASPYRAGPYRGRVTWTSTPLFPNSPVSQDLEASDQMTFQIRCAGCRRWQEILYPDSIEPFWEPGETPSKKEPVYRCRNGTCRKILKPKELIMVDARTLRVTGAEWVAAHPKRTEHDGGMRGYQVPFWL